MVIYNTPPHIQVHLGLKHGQMHMPTLPCAEIHIFVENGVAGIKLLTAQT